MAKGSNNSQAIKLQKQQMALSAQQGADMKSIMLKQIEAAKGMELPKFEGAAPPPSQSAQDVEQAGIDRRLKQMRSSGFNKTVFAGAA